MRALYVFAVAGAFVASCASSPRRAPHAEPTSGHESPSTHEAQIGGATPETSAQAAAPLEVLEGRASYYSDRLAGRSTASGEPYNPRALTAASRDLPFGSLVRVHRVDADGRVLATVTVEVNDRGPFRDHSRILDLSRAAAEALDMIRAGVVSIRAEVLRRGR